MKSVTFDQVNPLVTPNVFSQELCSYLVNRFETDLKPLFKQRVGHSCISVVPAESNFHCIVQNLIPSDIINCFFEGTSLPQNLKWNYDFMQIQKYPPGTYICPHKDIHEYFNLHLVVLTTNPTQGITLASDEEMIRIPDVAGNYIRHRYFWHWVGPITGDYTRYSVIIGE